MRKSLLSIFLVFCGVSLSAQDAEQPYLSVRETGETASSADLNRVIEKLTDVPSFTTMTYYSERRKKERILFEEAALLSIEPPLPDSGEAYAPRYEFELFLKDASFGDMKWAGEITCTDGVLSMKMTSITPIVNVKKMYGMMKAPPPLAPAQNGNFQMAPMPIAEPAEARMKPSRELH